eukprot:TRINITY_DN1161_c0_g1_i1.p1 TRINITY_DN1161_c0_g1~~TRINITY_DN1161_c0_g1_i1.p1  ORF type:complete len:278 (-),score=49.86 TRINITY_DN1161_c0_g1_i1:1220-2053(-)
MCRSEEAKEISVTDVVASQRFGAVRLKAAPRAALGIVQIASDLVMDMEGSLLVSKLPGVVIRHTKVAMPAEEICAETYEEMYADGSIHNALKCLAFPRGFCNQFGISCTSLSFTLGEERVAALFGDRPHTDMWRSVLAAFKQLCRPGGKVALLTPYVNQVHQKNAALLHDAGYDVVASHNLGLTVDEETSAVDPDYLAECAKVLAVESPAAPDLIFIGCSAFRACMPGFITQLEAELRKAGSQAFVVTSTQAFLWNMLRQTGVHDSVEGYGYLFSHY